jgi:signal transduction histidine kinase
MRTTLLASAVLTTVLLLVVYFFVTNLRDIELQDQEQLAKLWATQFANLLAYDSPRETLQMHARAIAFSEAHEDQIRQIRIYGETRMGLREVVKIAPDEPDEITGSDLRSLKRGEPIARVRRITSDEGTESVIYAAAPIFDENQFQGVVSLTTMRVNFSDLSRRITSLTIALLIFAIISITALLYFLFSEVLYKPVENLLRTMSEVRSGNLNVSIPVRARDEFGQLAISFNHMISRLQDMTAEGEAYQKRLEERVREATTELANRNAELEEANTSLFEIQRELTKFERLAVAGQMAAQFAHEVGTPLNLISGHVQLLAARTQDSKAQERLEIISSQIERIERIVRNLLDATRRPRPQIEPIDINSLLRRIIEITAPTLAAHEVELITGFDRDLPLIRGDSEQLQQVFINLINNSLDAMPQGGQLIFTTAVKDDEVEVRCRDTGEGIQDEIKKHVFEPFFTTKPRGQGSGLGLAVVQQILHEHGGSIVVANRLETGLEQGTEFQIRLPLAKSAREPEPAATMQPVATD